ncbi:hypothetical protein SKAU_G00226220 [Synaphobranchus kaupii]|uniref:Reverse transcriptase domain-containing protein n=1 Tax=Synaphobranchus kaupii TaxID=118154 RepID=A0A9Q1ISW2_SYNKA|nr:hypothetical protein SKAU_G00226220 [Synaphobranchus kaupii]
MEIQVVSNPILPAAGVRRSLAADCGAGPPSGMRHGDRTPNPEEGTSSPEGRVQSDHSTRSKALLRCRRPFTMGTFNANTVREDARLAELAHCAEESGMEILGVQEHRRVHQDPDPIVYSRVGGYSFITSSAWRNEAQAATGGVGLMLSSRARKALLQVYRLTERILIADFDGNPGTTIMVVYSPTNVAPAEEVERFYEDLGTAISDVPAHKFIAVLGDFNARLGPEEARFAYHDATNRNGEHLATLLTEQELLAANTLFQKRMGKRWTFQDRASGMLRQLDYILVRRKWRNSVTNAEPYSTFSTVGSDHRVVSMRVRLSLRVPKPSLRIWHDWKTFSVSPDLQARYTVEVRNRFQMLDVEEGPNAMYDRFVTAHVKATRECVPVMEKTRTSPRSRHPEVVAAREKVVNARRSFDREGTTENREALKEAKQLLFNTYDKIREEELMEKVHRVEAARGEQQYGEAWRGINEMSGRKRAKEGQVAGNSPEERMNTWFNHFRNLLGTDPTVEGAEEEIPAVLTHLNIDDGPFTAAELARVKSTLKQGKSAGPDCIPPEVLKNCDLDDITLETCNRALMKNNKPDMWSLSNIIPVPKSGDLSKPDNYRGISLTCVIAKMYNRMILNRIRGAIDPYLRENQNGFREGRTTVAQIFALRRIIEEVKRNNLTAVLCTRAKVVTPDGTSEEFDILAGVLQGDTLAPFLFIIVLDYALRQAIEGREKDLGFTITPRRSGRFPAIVLTDLDYADDISLISDRVEKAQELLTRVERECAKVGLRLNAKKTEVIAYNTPDHLPLRTTGDTALREVSDFKYLGSWVNSTEQDLRVRKALAWKALNGMASVWKSNLPREAKLHFFDATDHRRSRSSIWL